MAKDALEKKIDALTGIIEKGFAAVASDVADIKRDMATKARSCSRSTRR